MINKLSNSAFKTKYVFITFIFFALILYAFIINTVHKRDPNIIFSKQLSGVTLGIEGMMNCGFKKTLGFLIINEEKPYKKDCGTSVHRSYNFGWAHLNYFSQYIYEKIKNSNDEEIKDQKYVNLKLNSLQNLIYSFITSIILAFFCFKIFLFYNFSNVSAIFLSLGAQSIYITFPVHLIQYFELYPSTLFLMFFSIFLFLIFSLIFQKTKFTYLTFICAFFLGFLCGYVDWFFALFSLIWIYALIFFLDEKLLSNNLFKFYGLGFFTFLIYFSAQLIYLKFSLDITFGGSSFLFRSVVNL